MKDFSPAEFRSRWKAVEDIELKEQRSASMDLRWQQLNSLLCLARGMKLKIPEDVQEVRARWEKIKDSYEQNVRRK